MIIGVGTDILKISRIKDTFGKYGDRFAKKILCVAELDIFNDKNKSISFLAKRFSAKEAASKALGTGIRGVSWHDFEIKNNNIGAPELILTGEAKIRMGEIGARKTLISLSDESDYVLSFVVLFWVSVLSILFSNISNKNFLIMKDTLHSDINNDL